jgi:predicted transcriptional regulator
LLGYCPTLIPAKILLKKDRRNAIPDKKYYQLQQGSDERMSELAEINQAIKTIADREGKYMSFIETGTGQHSRERFL